MPPPLVFLGPSLPHRDAQRICPGEYHPPVVRGDLPALAGEHPRHVVIIDGAFEQVRAVSPKEIIATLDGGHQVYGASSMGALRAAELWRFGMHGEGRIAEWLRAETITADDEVAMLFDPETLRPLSDPLVCIRVALAEAESRGILDDAESRKLVGAATRLHYRDRSYERLLATSDLAPARRTVLLDFLHHEASDQKAEDARSVLRLVAHGGRATLRDERELPLRPEPPGRRPGIAALPPSIKRGGRDSVRTVPAAVTEHRLARVRQLVGITRVADITGLDHLGVPNFIAVRPSRDALCNSTYSGKSLLRAEARVGAQMEAMEIACGHDDRVPLQRKTWRALSGEGVDALHPDTLIPFTWAPRELENVPMEWVEGWDVSTGAPVLAPADVVFFRRDGRQTFWKVSSNGLASGNSLAEAIAHGLAELIERDAEAMFRIATEYASFPRMLRVVAGPARVQAPHGALPPPTDFPFIRTSSLPEPLRGLALGVRKAGIRVALRCITSDVGVPTLLCALHESSGDPRRHLVHYGCGAHVDPYIAARRALTEATQSRVTAIQGSREDLSAGAIAPSDPPAEWFENPETGISFLELSGSRNRDVRDDITDMLERLAAAGLARAVAVDVSNPALGFAVIRVLVPGLEPAFHHPSAERIALGWRARRYVADEN